MRVPTVVVRGDVLRSWLTVYDCSQGRFAEKLGVSKGCVSQILSSQHKPSPHLLAKLITVTELPFERLFKIVTIVPSKKPALRKGKKGNGQGHRNGRTRRSSARLHRPSSGR